MSLSVTVTGGDRRASLEALRDLLAAALDVAESGQVAALARQLQAVLKELAELPLAVEGDPIAQIAERRAARLSDASHLPRTAKRKVAGDGKRGSGSA